MSKMESHEHVDDPIMNSNGDGGPLRNTVTMSSEQFEKLYLNPKTEVKGDLRKTFANPTPLALMGFSVALFPLSIELMGWRGSGGGGAATTTCSIWFGGMLLIIAGFLEFILGNTFPFMVFMGYGAHYLTFATTAMPFYNAIGAYDPTGGQTQTPEFLASFGYYPLSLALLSFLFLICSLRTNVVFVLIFVFATAGFACASAAYFALALGNVASGGSLLVATGACFFVATIFGWYILFAIMLAVMDLPSLPVFDLSHIIKGQSEKAAAKQGYSS